MTKNKFLKTINEILIYGFLSMLPIWSFFAFAVTFGIVTKVSQNIFDMFLVLLIGQTVTTVIWHWWFIDKVDKYNGGKK